MRSYAKGQTLKNYSEIIFGIFSSIIQATQFNNFHTITRAPFASLKKQTETLFRLICCERKILFRLNKQAEKYEL